MGIRGTVVLGLGVVLAVSASVACVARNDRTALRAATRFVNESLTDAKRAAAYGLAGPIRRGEYRVRDVDWRGGQVEVVFESREHGWMTVTMSAKYGLLVAPVALSSSDYNVVYVSASTVPGGRPASNLR